MAVALKSIFAGGPDQLVTGAINSAPTGTALPTDEATALNVAFKDSGYISDGGLKIGSNQNSTEITDWSGNLVRTIMAGYGNQLTWEHLEWNEFSLKNFLGDANVTVTASVGQPTKITAKFNGDEMPVKEWVFNIKDGVRKIRVVVPNGQVSERGEISFLKTDAVKLPITLKTFPDASGNHIYVYSNDGVNN
jgi:hypothetical protein